MYLVGISGTAMFQQHDACPEVASKPDSSQPCPRTFAWDVRCEGSCLPTWCKTEKPLATLPPPNNLEKNNMRRTDLRDKVWLPFQSLILIISNLLWNVLLLLLLLTRFSCVRLCATPQTAAHEAPLSLGFSRQEHWSGLPFPSPMHESEKWKWSHSVVSDS